VEIDLSMVLARTNSKFFCEIIETKGLKKSEELISKPNQKFHQKTKKEI
jgi:hypothetical protein